MRSDRVGDRATASRHPWGRVPADAAEGQGWVPTAPPRDWGESDAAPGADAAPGWLPATARPALVHDYLVQMGGAERVLEEFAALFPDAPIYTGIVQPSRLPPGLRRTPIHATFLQQIRLPRRVYRGYLPFYPLAFEMLDLRAYDLVISSSSAFAKGVLTPPSACHVCYCHTPMRFVWDYHGFASQEIRGPLARLLLPLLVGRLRLWDRISADRVDQFVANSRVVAQRIRKFYGREATVIHPPVETSAFQPLPAPEREALAGGERDTYVVLSRLAPYKRIDVAIQAFNHLRLPLVVIGGGRDAARLQRMAGPTIHFLGRVSDAEVRERLAACRGLIWPGEEDFGMVPVEAMAAGRPVVAYRAGGVLETVEEGITGLFFDPQTPEALAAAVLRAEQVRWDPARLRERALRFDTTAFHARFRAFVAAAYAEHQEERERGDGRPPTADRLEVGEPASRLAKRLAAPISTEALGGWSAAVASLAVERLDQQ
jgi:glycosyltransferase involved in cell wall biosynthesis